MSNVNSPFGFKSSSFIAGTEPNFGLSVGYMAYNASATYRGDAIILSSGLVAVATTTGNTGAAVVGIAESFKWVSIALGRTVWASYYPGNDSQGNANVEVLFQGNPNSLFDVQSSGAAITQANVGEFINFTTGTPNTYSGTSGMSADQTTINATQGTLPFVIYSILQAPGTDPTSSYNIIRVGFATQTKL